MTFLPTLPDDGGNDPRGFGGMTPEHGSALPLKAMDVRARITGLVVQTVVRQTFVNNVDAPIEATYTFPLPPHAAVASFEMHVANRVVRGEIKERAQARSEYKTAIRSGRRAAITEEERPSVFTIRVGNILPREEAEIRLVMTETLPVVDGEVTWRFPLVVAPRYTPGAPLDGAQVGEGTQPDTDIVRDASRLSPPVLLPGSKHGVRLALAVDVDAAGLGAHDLRASLDTAVIEDDAARGTKTLSLRPGRRLDRDFVLRFRISDDQIASSLRIVRDHEGEDATFMLTVVPSTVAGGAQKPRDVVFLIDRSPSMMGWKFTAARRALVQMISTLHEGDRFRVLAFDDGIITHGDAFSAKLDEATPSSRIAALQFLSSMTLGSGTIIDRPLELGLELLAGGYQERERLLVLITDGQVTNEAQVLQALESRIGGTRIFIVGIDEAVNCGLLTRLATTSGGACELVESAERLDEVMERLHRRIQTPVLSELSLSFEGMRVESDSVVPSRLPALFSGAAMIVMGRCKATTSAPRAIVSGARADGSSAREVIDGQYLSVAGARHAWARMLLRDLEDHLDRRAKRAGLRERITETSIKESVLCRFTAFLAVDQEIVAQPGAEPRKVVQPVEAPEWDAPRRGARLGELFVRESLITPQELQTARAAQKAQGGKLGYHLARLGFLEELQLTDFLSKQYGVPVINLSEFEIDEDILKLVPREVCEKHGVVPVNCAGTSLIVAMSDPSNIFAIDDLKFLTGYNIEVVVAAENAIEGAIDKYYRSRPQSDVLCSFNVDDALLGGLEDICDDDDGAAYDGAAYDGAAYDGAAYDDAAYHDAAYDDADDDDAVSSADPSDPAKNLVTLANPIARLVEHILIDAKKKRAVFILVELDGQKFRVSYRIGGAWAEVILPPAKIFRAVVARIKALAKMSETDRAGVIERDNGDTLHVIASIDGAFLIAL